MYGIVVMDINELKNIPIYKYGRPLEEICIGVKLITGYKYDDSKTKLVNNFGDLFSFQSHRTEYGTIKNKEAKGKLGENLKPNEPIYEITIWDLKGTTHLYCKCFQVEKYDSPIPKDIIDEIETITNMYSKGKVKCSDCEKEINRIDIAGNYFAAKFCKDCWLGNTGKHRKKGGWKYIESQESYN